MSPKCAVEIIGVSKWDGIGRSNVYPHGLLVVTHHGATYYISAPSNEEKSQWMIHIRAGLESNFGNTEIVEYKPSKACFDVPEPQKNSICPKTGVQLNPNNSLLCKSCGRLYTMESLQVSPILQIGFEEMVKICNDCKDAQACLSWIKSLIYVHTLDLHEQTEEVLVKVDRYKASFKLRRNISTRLNMAAQLKDDGQVDEMEFEALRKIDHEYRQDALLEECDRMKLALEALENDMQSIIGFLRNPNMTISSSRKDSGSLHSGIRLYYLVVLRLLEVSDSDPDLIDFYWPQVMQVHLLLAKYRTPLSMAMVDMLQQGILAIALRYPYLALKLSWAILASIGDYQENKITQSQYCACVLLLLQLEVLTYGVCSCLTDIIHASHVIPHHTHHNQTTKSKSVLHGLLNPAHHQRQELMIEIYTLLRVRRRIHQVNQEEEKQRRLNNLKTSVLSQYDGRSSESTPSDTAASSTKVETPLISDSQSMTAVSLFLSGCSDPTVLATDGTNISDSKSPKIPHYTLWKGLSAQLDFTNKLTDLVDTLRFIDRPLRCDHLKAELLRSFVLPDGTLTIWGLDPTGAAGEPPYRIHKIFLDDVKVFRTKARAPSLLLFEVVLDGDFRRIGQSNIPHTQESHHSIVPMDSSNPNVLQTDINHLVEERMLKTVEDMNRERLNSENQEEISQKLSSNSTTTTKTLNKSYSTNDIATTSASSTLLPSKTRKLSSTGYVHPTVFTHSAIPDDDFDRVFVLSPTDSLSPYDTGLEPFQTEGLPDEDIEVTMKVITSANNLLQSGAITQEEYNQLVQSDCKYRDEAKLTDSERTKAKLQHYYGEEWNEKKDRLLGISSLLNDPLHVSATGNNSTASSTWHVTEYSNRNRSRTRSRSIPENTELNSSRLPSSEKSNDEGAILSFEDITITDPSHPTSPSRPLAPTSSTTNTPTPPQPSYQLIKDWPQRDIRSFIVKSNDDLRQEVACIQLIELCQEIFNESNLGDMLWLKPYRIISTGPSAGFVETLPNTLSIDAIKKTNGFISLPKYFDNLYGSSTQRLHQARMNYVASIAAYSLITYILNIKDRHNGNILFDSDGHIIHIDFGFLLGIAPGGSFSVETAPFKLTHEMLEIFGGLDSHYFSLFVKAFTTGFLALKSKSTAIITTIEVMSQDCTFPCFHGKDVSNILEKLKLRFRNDLNIAETVEYCLDLIIQSYSNLGTKNYDTFQYYTNGIIP